MVIGLSIGINLTIDNWSYLMIEYLFIGILLLILIMQIRNGWK